MNTDIHQAILEGLNAIDESEFDSGPAGWRGEISTALLDAVFSIRARYDSPTPGKGVLGRVKSFREEHPNTCDDLESLHDLGTDAVTGIMGATQTAGRSKSSAVVEAAHELIDMGVTRAADITEDNVDAVKRVYIGVHGLGWITFEYFLMLLGMPGIKADTMITRFVNSALAEAGHDSVNAQRANSLLKEVFEEHNEEHWGDLTSFDHAIWRYQRTR